MQKSRVCLLLICAALSAASCTKIMRGGGFSILFGHRDPLVSIPERLDEYGEAARTRLKPYFKRARLSYPPYGLTLLGLKQERRLELYGHTEGGATAFIRSYPILGSSGTYGPKLKEGDEQIPEGFYRIESLNPNSRFHLSLRLDYPNAFDRAQAEIDGRMNLGGDIMIHGSNISTGCLAMGDQVAEDLFVLAADTGLENIQVMLAPYDFRTGANFELADSQKSIWVWQLYAELAKELDRLPIRLPFVGR